MAISPQCLRKQCHQDRRPNSEGRGVNTLSVKKSRQKVTRIYADYFFTDQHFQILCFLLLFLASN